MSKFSRKLIVLLTVVSCLMVSTLYASRGRYKKLHVLPAKNVKIDGDLNDWDLSGQITTFVVPETADMMSGKFAMMYDKDALYISGVVRDDSPMMNRHNPKTDPRKGWDADVCQIFLSLDPDEDRPLTYSRFKKEHDISPTATMLMWYYTDDKLPTLSMYYGMKFKEPVRPELNKDGVIPNTHFDGAYKKMDDNMGYSFEYRIPWKTMKIKRVPKAGDELAATVCVFWGRPDGLKTAGGSSWAYDVMSRGGFPFQDSGCWGDLVFEKENNISRNVVDSGLPPQKPLPLKFEYTLPEDGEVTVQLFDKDNKNIRILVPQQERKKGKNIESWDGLDDNGKPIPPGEYTVKTVIHDPITWKYRFSVNNSGKPAYPTADNKGGWGGDHGTPTTVCQVPGGMVLAWNGCEYGWGVIKVDNQGNKQWGSKYCAEHLATDGKRLFTAGGHSFNGQPGVNILNVNDSRPISLPNGKPTFVPPEGGDEKSNHISGLAYAKNILYVAFKDRNLIAVYNAKNGKLLKTWKIEAPGQLAVIAPENLAVISNSKVLSVKDGKSSVLITTHLDKPAGIDVAKDGTIYVANRGNLQNVSVFDKAGKYLRSLGIKGGRPAKGRYNPEGMYMAGGIALDSDGKLWVAEITDGPKRHSVWNTTSGKLENEFFGGSSYFGYGFIDPADPSMIYAHHVLWKIDWKKMTGTPYTTIWRTTAPNMVSIPGPCGYRNVLKMMTADNGKQFCWGKGNGQSTLARRDGDLFKPFISVMMIRKNRNKKGYRGPKMPVIKDNIDKLKNGTYFWQDANDDQTIQLEEILLLEKDKSWAPGICWIDKDMTLWLASGYKLKPAKFLDNGQPVYDLSKIDETFLNKHKGSHHGYTARDDKGNTFTFRAGKGPSLVGWTPDGQLAWSYNDFASWHSALSKPIVDKGRLWGMTGLMGVGGDFFANMTYFGPNHIFNKDGVYVATVLKDGRIAAGQGKKDGSGTDDGQPEGQNGQFVKLNIDGKDRYFVIHGGQDSRVWEVLGLNSVKSLPNWNYDLTPASAKLAKTKFDEYQKEINKQQKLMIAKGARNFNGAKQVRKIVDNKREFGAKATYDDKRLCFEFDVKTDSPLINGQSSPNIIYRGGNLIDIQIATDPNANPKRKKPAVGDLRFLITRKNNKPFVVLLQPKVKDFKGKPIVLTSPTGQESFDRIEVIDDVKLEYRKSGHGFLARVYIPKSRLGDLKLAKGNKIKMDLGYIFGNKNGTRTTARAYWKNNSFTANVTNDIPHESRLEPAEWGQAKFE